MSDKLQLSDFSDPLGQEFLKGVGRAVDRQNNRDGWPTKGMGSHQSARMENDEWLTPPEIIKSLGVFDLDPCSPVNRPWPTAKHHYTVENNGLNCDWFGRVWLNPPYGSQTGLWLEKLAKHGSGIALIFARTETECWFRHVWPQASAILFLEGRLFFHRVDGSRAKHNAGAPSALVAFDKHFGNTNRVALRDCGVRGHLATLINQIHSV